MSGQQPIRAVLFDLDGTLTNTLADIANAMNWALTQQGLAKWPEDKYRYLVGDGARKLAERAVRERQDLLETVLRLYQRQYETHNAVLTAPYAGIPELLQALRAKGVPLCVLSNKPDADTRFVVSHYFPDIDFACVRGQLPEVPVKPDPTGALQIAAELGLTPGSFAYLGDTGIDMACAVHAGMQPFGVLWGFRNADELLESGAAILLSHPIELLNYLE